MATAPNTAVATLNQPKIKRLFAEKIRYTGASFWMTRITINFHQIKFSATKMTQRCTGAKPSFAMMPGIKIINEPIAWTKKYVTAEVTSPTSKPVPTISGITLTMLTSSQIQMMNHLLLIKTPTIETIKTNQ